MSKHALCVIATAAVLSAAVFGCGSAEQTKTPAEVVNPSQEIEKEEPVLPAITLEDNQKFAADVSEEFADLADENGVITALRVYEMDAEEIAKISDNEARAICAVYIDDYRKTYGINSEYEMTSNDWDTLKVFMAYQITGELPKESGDVSDNETFSKISNEEVRAAVNEATTDEFREFVEGIAEDSGDDDLKDGIQTMSDEEIEELRIAYMEWLEALPDDQ